MDARSTSFPPPPWRSRDKRISPRLDVSTLHCRLGRVQDISEGGLRVRGLAWRGLRTYGAMRIIIRGLDEPVHLEAEVAWVNRGLLRREVGLAFTSMPEEALAKLRPFFSASREGRRAAA